MTESFADLYNSMEQTDHRLGALLKAKVVTVTPEYVIVNAGLKSEARIPIDEFRDYPGQEINLVVGDEIDVILDAVENGSGETCLSREKAKRAETWEALERSYKNKEHVLGVIVERVKGGFTVDIGKVKAFLPGSLLDTKPVKDISHLEGKELEFEIVKMDKEHFNVVVSRRSIVAAEAGVERMALLGTLNEGDEVTGTVKNMTDYGAFIDLGGADGLLHITDISWRRIRHPNEVLKLGDEVRVKILKFDREKNRVSLGLKQLEEDPWKDIARRFPIGTRVFGKITNIADYGCFVEIESGIEGLVHMSEMDWTNKNISPSKFVASGQEVEVMVLDVDVDKRRISLGMKQCKSNPWQEFADSHKKDDKITGVIKSITDFGLFLGLEGNIDGLVHISDISWTEPGEKALRNYKKGQEVETVILGIDVERERISLGIRQLQKDIYADYLTAHPKGEIVKGKVTEVTPKVAVVDLGESIIGRINAPHVSRAQVKDVTEFLAVGDEIEAMVLGFDKKGRHINLSIKETQPELSTEAPANTQLGDLLKEQISAGTSAEEKTE